MTTHPTLWFEHFVEKPQTSEMMKQFDIFLVKTTVITWVVVSNIFYFHPYLGKWSKLTYNFQMGWNHQLDNFKPPLCDVKITILHDVFSIVTCQTIFAIVFMYIYLHLPYKSNQKVSRSTIPLDILGLALVRARGKLPGRWQSSSTRSTSRREDVPWNGRVSSGRRQLYWMVGIGRDVPRSQRSTLPGKSL